MWLYHALCGILIPWPVIEPIRPAVEVQSLNHWTTWEVPYSLGEENRNISNILDLDVSF